MTRTTLATDLSVQTHTGITHQRDVPVMVEDARSNTRVTLGWANRDRVVVVLTEAERIALIEALGGFATPREVVVVRFFDEDGAQVGAVKVR